MRSAIAVLALALLVVPLGTSQTSIRSHARHTVPPALDDVSSVDAHSFAHWANPAREMIDDDAPVNLSDDIYGRRQRGPVRVPLRTSYRSGDNLYRLEVRRLNLRGGAISRFLTMVIDINAGLSSQGEFWIFGKEQIGGVAPDELIEALALRGCCGQSRIGAQSLVNLNDSGKSFPEIADFCESHPEAVFTEPR